jgi:hypothetical protein
MKPEFPHFSALLLGPATGKYKRVMLNPSALRSLVKDF